MYRDKNQRDFARTLRNVPTDAEKRLWHFLRAQKLRGHKFRRQAAIGPYVVDFVCLASKLIVELDGPQHLEPNAVEHDQRRTNWLTERGFRLIRFRNQELDENIHAVVDAIERVPRGVGGLSTESPLPIPPRRGEGARLRLLRFCSFPVHLTLPASSSLPVPSPLRGGLGRGTNLRSPR